MPSTKRKASEFANRWRRLPRPIWCWSSWTHLKRSGPAIRVENKSDKTSSQFLVPSAQLRRVRVSALTSEGVPELRAEILRQIGDLGPNDPVEERHVGE